MCQQLHKGLVNAEHHRQYAAGYPWQNGARADEHAAQQVTQPMDDEILIVTPFQSVPSRKISLFRMISVLTFACNPMQARILKKVPLLPVLSLIFVYLHKSLGIHSNKIGFISR